MEINLQLIGYFAILIIIVSIFSIGVKLTGKVSSSGDLNISIEESAEINFTTDYIDFGSGNVDLGVSNAIIDTTGTVENANWTAITEGFVLENTGNINVSLYLKSDKTAEEFLGGTSPSYQYNISNLDSGSCSSSVITFGQWYEVNVTDDGTKICDFFSFDDTHDSIRIDLRLVIPSDAVLGSKSSTFTATGIVAS